MRRVLAASFVVASILVAGACSDDELTPFLDLGLDASTDGAFDVSRPDTQAPRDVGVDVPVEAATDGSQGLVQDAGSDAGNDEDAGSSTDAGLDAASTPDAADAATGPDASDAASGGPILVATGFGKVLTVLVDATNVYFTTYGTTTTGTYNKDGTVVRCPVDGGCAASSTVLATGLDNPMFLAIEGSTLVIGSGGAQGSGKFDGHVYTCPLAGCGASNVDRVTISPALQNLGGIAARGGYAYWVQTPTDNTCSRARFDGTGLQRLGNAFRVSSVGVTVDDANAYWTHTYYPPAIHVAPFTGDGGRVLVDIVAVDAGLAPVSLTHDNGYLYWASQLRNEVDRVQVDGGGLQTLAAGMHGPTWIAVDATHVYVADYYQPRPIRRLLKSGGPASVIANSVAQITWLAVNDGSVFWSTDTGQVWRLPK